MINETWVKAIFLIQHHAYDSLDRHYRINTWCKGMNKTLLTLTSERSMEMLSGKSILLQEIRYEKIP